MTSTLTATDRAAMDSNPWFASMPQPMADCLLAAAERVSLRRGAMLFRAGDPAQAAGAGFFGLVGGRIKASTLRSDGREAILAVLEPGNWFGEITLIDGAPRTHDATALTASELLVVPADAFARLMQDAGFANAVARLLAARVRALYGLMEDATLRGLRARVARRILALARGDATQTAVPQPDVRLPQESLAMMLGVTRQTLSRELNALAADGVIAIGYGRVRVLSFEGLEQVAR